MSRAQVDSALATDASSARGVGARFVRVHNGNFPDVSCCSGSGKENFMFTPGTSRYHWSKASAPAAGAGFGTADAAEAWLFAAGAGPVGMTGPVEATGAHPADWLADPFWAGAFST